MKPTLSDSGYLYHLKNLNGITQGGVTMVDGSISKDYFVTKGILSNSHKVKEAGSRLINQKRR